MEGEVDAGVAPPIFLHEKSLLCRFSDDSPMAKKRDFYHAHSALSTLTNPNSWNSKMWEWDSMRFSSKPSEDLPKDLCLASSVEGENLSLKLGGGGFREEEQVARANKRVRSGSPANAASYPMCQVDDCKADLSNVKDYHRRHKVCELHSKMAKALVGKQMQRFCQQCSR